MGGEREGGGEGRSLHYLCWWGCAVLLCLVCLTLLASSFLLSHFSLNHVHVSVQLFEIEQSHWLIQ